MIELINLINVSSGSMELRYKELSGVRSIF
jgi:hypothetical protein